LDAAGYVGVIAGEYYDAAGNQHGFTANPVETSGHN
jgi:hypothetical protein